MITLLLMGLMACSTPAAPEPSPAPTPAVPAPPVDPEPAPADAAPVMLTFGKACEEPAAGEPADLNAVKEALEAAGIAVASIEAASTCEACGTCPRFAVEVTTAADEATVRDVFAPKAVAPADGNLVFNIGTKCEQPTGGVPLTVEELLAALEGAGITVESHETRMACAACGCPELSVGVKVAPADGQKALDLAAPWAPKPKPAPSLPGEGEPGKLKGSLP